ncbi:hypothetical protein LSAT2_022943 [Lamellibrachia satsuma]|nr:hypothetical protein LSAT2_022943 [Lamellibrachia satsuma]
MCNSVVQIIPECQLITSVPVFYNVTLGGNHTFACNASEDVSWKRKEEIHQGRTLVLVNVRQIQEGYYYCHATSSVCTQSVRFKLTVLHYWETDGIKKFESDGIEVKPGKSVVVNCSVTGQPVPNVQWSRLIDDDSSNPSLGNASVGWSLLELHSFQADDAGQYVCSASYLDFHTNWTISIKLVDDGSGLQTWVIVVIVVLCVVLLGVLVLFLLLKLLLNKSPEKAIEPFGSKTKLIVVGLLVVILLPGIGIALVISYYLVKVTESSNGEEPKRERTPSNATASKVHPETTGNEEQVISNNGTKGGAVTPALSAVSGTPLALSGTVTQMHGGSPMKLDPLVHTETNDVVNGQEEKKKKKKKKKKHRKQKHEEDVENEVEDVTAETTLVSGDPEET